MPKRYATLAAAALAVAAAAATLAWAAPAVADTPGFTVNITQVPDTFTVGNQARTVTAVASTDRLRRCVKVRWALDVSTQGISLDQIRVTRIEGGQAEPLRTQLQQNALQAVDTVPDTGQLCRGQTDTGQWAVSFVGPDNGAVSFAAEVLSEQGQGQGQAGQVLATGQAASRVVSPVAAQGQPTTQPTDEDSRSASASDSASPSASASPSFSAQPDQAAINPVNIPSSADPAALARKTSGLNVLLPGLLVGAVLVFAGFALLLRLRARNRKRAPAGWTQDTRMLPTGFYNMPRRD